MRRRADRVLGPPEKSPEGVMDGLNGRLSIERMTLHTTTYHCVHFSLKCGGVDSFGRLQDPAIRHETAERQNMYKLGVLSNGWQFPFDGMHDNSGLSIEVIKWKFSRHNLFTGAVVQLKKGQDGPLSARTSHPIHPIAHISLGRF